MKFISIICCLALSIFSGLTLAHEGHNHMPVSMKKASELALAAAAEFTRTKPSFADKPLTESWRDLPQSASTIYENGRGFYMVRVENEKAGKSLYVRVLLDGTIDSTNFSGNFPPVRIDK